MGMVFINGPCCGLFHKLDKIITYTKSKYFNGFFSKIKSVPFFCIHLTIELDEDWRLKVHFQSLFPKVKYLLFFQTLRLSIVSTVSEFAPLSIVWHTILITYTANSSCTDMGRFGCWVMAAGRVWQSLWKWGNFSIWKEKVIWSWKILEQLSQADKVITRLSALAKIWMICK